MVFSPPDFPVNITLQPILGLMPLTDVYLNPGLFCLVLHTTLCSVRQMKPQPIFTALYPTLALVSNTYTLLTSSHSPTIPSFPITYQYHMDHSSPYTQLIFLPYMVFECRHNLRNQHVSTAIPSPSSFRDITTIRKHQHLGETVFLCFLRHYCIQLNTTQKLPALVFIRTHKNQFICAVATSFSVHQQPKNSEFYSGRIQPLHHTNLKHFSLPQHLPTPTTYNITILLPIPTGKEPTYLEYLIDSTLNIVSKPTYPAHYQPKDSGSVVQPYIRAQYNNV